MKLLKITLATLGGLVLLGFLGIAAFCFLINPNDFKGPISQQVYKLTGRSLRIDGDLHWSFYPALGITVNQLALDNAPGFGATPFATVGKANISVKLLPLFKKHIETKTIDISDVQLNLIRNAKGQTNWDDLKSRLGASAKPTTVTSKSIIAAPAAIATNENSFALEIPSMKVENASLSWQDQMAQQKATLQIVDFSSDTMNLMGRAFPIMLNLRFSSTKPAVAGDLFFNGTFVLDAKQDIYSIKKLMATSHVTGPMFPNHQISAALNAQATANLNKQQIIFSQFDWDINGLKTSNRLTMTYLNKHLSYQGTSSLLPGNVNQWLNTMGITLLANSPKTLSRVSAEMEFAGTDHALTMSKLKADLDGATLTGNINLLDFQKKVATFDLAMNRLNLNDGGVFSATSAAKTPDVATRNTVRPERPTNFTAATSAAPSTPTSTSKNSFSYLRDINLKGHLAIDELMFNDVKAQNVVTDITAASGLVTLGPSTANLYGGHYTGNIRFDVSGNTPGIQLQQRLDAVSIHPLLKDLHSSNTLTTLFGALNGPANLSIQLTSKGSDNATFTKNLNGAIQFSLENGSIEGVNLNHVLNMAVAILKPNAALVNDSGKATSFASLKGSLTINQGIMQPSPVTLASPLFSVHGNGSIDLNTSRVDYTLQLTTLGDTIPVIKQLENLLGGSIPIRISGTLDHLKVGTDEKAIFSITKEKIKDNIGKSLNGLKALFR
jgi:AsmA protein